MKTEAHKNQDPNIQKLGELIQGIPFAMLTTLDPDGSLRSRPMACLEVDFDGDLWFFTSKASGKIHSIANDQQVNLAYAKPDDQKYVSVSGIAEVVEDPEKEKELWKPVYKAWFPKGLEDPDLVLLRIRVQGAEYWDSHASAVVHLIGFTKAILTGEPYQGGKEEHDKISIHRH